MRVNNNIDLLASVAPLRKRGGTEHLLNYPSTTSTPRACRSFIMLQRSLAEPTNSKSGKNKFPSIKRGGLPWFLEGRGV